MQQNASFLVITEQAVHEGPKALQEYVERFFRKQRVFGKDCWVAFQTLGLRSNENGQGVAPSHMLDMSQFSEDLYGTVQEYKKDPGRCFSFSALWDDGCIGPSIDMD